MSFFKAKHDLYETSNETVKHQSYYKFLVSVPRAPVGRVINYFCCAQGEISTIIEPGRKKPTFDADLRTVTFARPDDEHRLRVHKWG